MLEMILISMCVLMFLAIIWLFKRLFRIKVGKQQLKKNPKIKPKDYSDKQEYFFDKKTDLVPDKRNRLLCVMFSEEKGCHFLIRHLNNKLSSFRFRDGLYMIDNEAIHITSNGARVAFYMEGISTPIKMSNIEKQVITKEYTDLYGKIQKTKIQIIKGLKFDAKILDTFANREFARIFTKKQLDNFQLFIMIFSIITMVLVVISWGVTYYFSGN
jgi:hypothetical protein